MIMQLYFEELFVSSNNNNNACFNETLIKNALQKGIEMIDHSFDKEYAGNIMETRDKWSNLIVAIALSATAIDESGDTDETVYEQILLCFIFYNTVGFVFYLWFFVFLCEFFWEASIHTKQ